MKNSIKKSFSHERVTDGKDEWLTPVEIIQSVGPFDLDPCSPISRPWPTAANHFTKNDDGLKLNWFGNVWMNPPYGNETIHWMRKLKKHGNGIALIFARTETKTFHECVWGAADGILWLKGRIKFCHVNGQPAKNSGGAPSVLIAYGKDNAERLKKSLLKGCYTDSGVFYSLERRSA